MAKKTKSKRYFVLGSKNGASVFVDPQSKLKVVSNKTPVEYLGPITARISVALKHNHIKDMDEDKALKALAKAAKEKEENPNDKKEVKAPEAPLELTEEEKAEQLVNSFTKKDDAIDYYKENFEHDEDTLAKFSELKLKEMKEYLLEDEEPEKD